MIRLPPPESGRRAGRWARSGLGPVSGRVVLLRTLAGSVERSASARRTGGEGGGRLGLGQRWLELLPGAEPALGTVARTPRRQRVRSPDADRITQLCLP
jgi:hypothetical protein